MPGQPLTLRSVGHGPGGQGVDGRVSAGECVKIMTGAVMPAGLDTVVPQEFTQRDGAATIPAVTTRAPGGQIAIAPDVLRLGDNRRFGRRLDGRPRGAGPWRLLTPACAGLLASLGLPTVTVRGACAWPTSRLAMKS